MSRLPVDDMTLRQLSRAHASGQLSLSDYRTARTRLIEGILSGDIPLRENEPLTVPGKIEADSTEPGDTRRKTPPANADTLLRSRLPGTDSYRGRPPSGNASQAGSRQGTAPAPARRGSLKGPLIAAALGSILFAVAVVTILTSPVPPRQGDPAGADPAQTLPATPEPAPAASELIRSFLREDSWDEASIRAFLQDWQALTPEQRASARGSAEMSRLANAIFKQLLAERALSGLQEDSGAMDRQRLLVDFARAMGIDDPRLSLPGAGPDTGAVRPARHSSGSG